MELYRYTLLPLGVFMACTGTISPSDYNALYECCAFVGQCWQKIPKYQHRGLHWNWRIECSEILLYVDPC